VSVIPPPIDAFSPKNHAMACSSATAVLRAAGLACARRRARARVRDLFLGARHLGQYADLLARIRAAP
jgi:hypothetical protein